MSFLLKKTKKTWSILFQINSDYKNTNLETFKIIESINNSQIQYGLFQ